MIRFLILGFLIGALISSVWDYYFDGYFCKIYRLSNYLEILEHYHHGLILIITSFLFTYPVNYILTGIGIQLIYDERIQKNPFALGKEYFKYSSIIGITLVTILTVVVFYEASILIVVVA